jgi:hypothetical protein
MILLKWWREILILLLSLVVTYYVKFRKPNEVVKVVDKVVTVEKIRTVTKVVEKRPDGTTIETVVDRDENKTKEKEKTSDKVIVSQPREKYSVGVAARNFSYKDLLIDVGARLGDTPLEATLGYETKDRAVLMGVRWRW